MNDVILPLYHIYHCVFVPMEHYCQLRQMSTRYQAMSQTLPCLYASEMWYRFDGYLQILSSIILFINPNPFIIPNRLTGAPYLALGNYAIYAYLIHITHVPDIMMAVHQTPLSYCFCTPQLGVQLITSSVGFVAPSSLHSQLYHTWFYLSSIIFVINIPIATPAANEPRQDNKIIIH